MTNKGAGVYNHSMIKLENVVVTGRDQEGRDVTLLDGISFAAGQGEITAIIGPSGGGKSALIRLINRLADPVSGTIRLGGEEIAVIDPLLLRRRVAMVPQKPFMFVGTVYANLQRPFDYRHQALPLSEKEIRTLLELVRLPDDMLERDARSLSVGEQQRVALARALVTHPEVLLLDEPTSALDRPTADRLASTLHDISRAQLLSVIMVTHDLRLAEKIADHLIFLENGKIREQGTVADLLKNPQSKELRSFLAMPED